MSDTDEPRYVWLVHYGNYGDRWLHGVYDSEEKVQEFICPPDEDRWRWDYEVSKERLL